MKKFVCAVLFFNVLIVSAAVLNANGVLNKGQSLSSDDGRYRLVMQMDGNVVLYRSDGSIRFATYQYGGYLVMQGDGNLVEYSGTNQPLWYTRTGGNIGAYLNVQNDGNLVVYNNANVPKWSIGSDPNLSPSNPKQAGDIVGRDLSYSGVSWAGHVGMWDGNVIVEVTDGLSNAVTTTSLSSFKATSTYWGAATPTISDFVIYDCFAARCTNFQSQPWGQIEKVSARMALVKRAYQSLLIGADYTLTATYSGTYAGDYYHPAQRGVYRCDTFLLDTYEIFQFNMNERYHEPINQLWVNRVNALSEFPLLPKSFYDRMKGF